MPRYLLLLLFAILGGCGQPSTPPAEDAFLKTLLESMRLDPWVSGVCAETAMLEQDEDSPRLRARIGKELVIPGCDVLELYDRLCESNATPARWTLESSLERGYVVDHDGAYASHFQDFEHPGVSDWLSISRPVFDARREHAMVYIGKSAGMLMGSGWIAVYEIDAGQLIRLRSCELWIS